MLARAINLLNYASLSLPGIKLSHFSARFQLTEHQNVHLGLKPHQCDQCDKKFHKRILLRQHKLIHLPEADLFECCKYFSISTWPFEN